MAVTNRLVGELFDAMEPDLRRVMATLVARQFTVEELSEMTAFFATPVGQRWMRMSMTIGQDPAYQEVLLLMTPRITEMQRRLLTETNAATAHLVRCRVH